jgi:hypothetical protein
VDSNNRCVTMTLSVFMDCTYSLPWSYVYKPHSNLPYARLLAIQPYSSCPIDTFSHPAKPYLRSVSRISPNFPFHISHVDPSIFVPAYQSRGPVSWAGGPHTRHPWHLNPNTSCPPSLLLLPLIIPSLDRLLAQHFRRRHEPTHNTY